MWSGNWAHAAGATVMLYVQTDHAQDTLRIAVEDGAMGALFDNGYIALNAKPITRLLDINEQHENLWLRSLADDIGADHVLLITYGIDSHAEDMRLTGRYRLIEIARPGSLAAHTRIERGNNRRAIRVIAERLGAKIVEEILTKLP